MEPERDYEIPACVGCGTLPLAGFLVVSCTARRTSAAKPICWNRNSLTHRRYVEAVLEVYSYFVSTERHTLYINMQDLGNTPTCQSDGVSQTGLFDSCVVFWGYEFSKHSRFFTAQRHIHADNTNA